MHSFKHLRLCLYCLMVSSNAYLYLLRHCSLQMTFMFTKTRPSVFYNIPAS